MPGPSIDVPAGSATAASRPSGAGPVAGTFASATPGTSSGPARGAESGAESGATGVAPGVAAPDPVVRPGPATETDVPGTALARETADAAPGPTTGTVAVDMPHRAASRADSAARGPAAARPRRLPGDRKPDVAAMVRVDQAGEYGAARIYAGQLAVMGARHPMARDIRHMAEQEARHLAAFDAAMTERRVRPTLLQPVWHVGGFVLGAVTALMGPRAAMACTAAVETEIDRHYEAQRGELGPDDPALSAQIADFQADEQEHRRLALEARAEDAPGYPLLAAAIRAGCRAAIAVARRI